MLTKCEWNVHHLHAVMLGGGLKVPVVSSVDVPGWSATGVGASLGLFAAGSAAASGS